MAHDTTTMSSLISGLPDEVAFRCLARVPFLCHGNLRLVCRSWRAALCSPEVFKVRGEAGVSEEFLCVLYVVYDIPSNPTYVCQLYDPCRDHWLTLTVVPSELRYLHCFGVASVAGKLFVLGGIKEPPHAFILATDAVWSYDPFCREWSRRANMLVPRFSFACCSLDGKIVVAGGFTNSGEIISKAEIYNPDTDTWRSLPDLRHTHTSACSGVVIGGKIHVLHQGQSAVQILEDGRQWSVEEDFGWPQGPMAVVGEEHYILNVEGFILKHRQENNLFYRLVALPLTFNASIDDIWGFLFVMIGVGDDLYVIGPRMTNSWKEKLGIINVLSCVNSNSPTWRKVSKMPGRSGIIQNCALLKV